MKKKGFTLVELLAVIVVLAVIALIATPMILGVIDNAKKGAARNSALGYIDAVEKYMTMNRVNKTKYTLTLTDGVYDVSELEEIKVKGTVPSAGWIQVENKEVVNYSIVMEDYVVSNGKAEIGTEPKTAPTE